MIRPLIVVLTAATQAAADPSAADTAAPKSAEAKSVTAESAEAGKCGVQAETDHGQETAGS